MEESLAGKSAKSTVLSAKSRYVCEITCQLRAILGEMQLSREGSGVATPAGMTTRHEKEGEQEEAPSLAVLRAPPGLLPYPTHEIVDVLVRKLRQHSSLLDHNSDTALRRMVKRAIVRMRVSGDFLSCKGLAYHYVVYHKPAGVLSEYKGSGQRVQRRKESSLSDALPKHLPHLPPVGRLDKDTSGLLLLTDDVNLHDYWLKGSTNELNSGGSCSAGETKVSKVYYVDVAPGRGMLHVNGKVAVKESLLSMREPLIYSSSSERNARVKHCCDPAVVELLPLSADSAPLAAGSACRFRVELREGKNRQVRRLCARAGLIVIHLARVAFGVVHLRGLAAGATRDLTQEEVYSFYKQSTRLQAQAHVHRRHTPAVLLTESAGRTLSARPSLLDAEELKTHKQTPT